MTDANGRKKIIIVYCLLTSYVKRDIEILNTKYDVVEICARNIKSTPRAFLSIAKHMSSSELILGWFADYPTFWANLLAKFFRRRSVTIIIGYEVARNRQIPYGRLLRKDGIFLVRLALQSADKLLAVSQFTKNEAINNLQFDSGKVDVLYHAFPIPTISENLLKENLVLTVAFIKWANLVKKGIRVFVQSAKYLPRVSFVVLGDWLDDSINYLRKIAPPNVEFIQVGQGGAERLDSYYRKAKVYVQASIHESFGCSLAEAMLWQCVPVVTNRGALPEVVGDTGFYVSPEDPEGIASQISVALKSDKGIEARQRIIDKFPITTRREALLRIVKGLIGD
jgi:glycosyltransferase involved in cell wall biosynthesis